MPPAEPDRTNKTQRFSPRVKKACLAIIALACLTALAYGFNSDTFFLKAAQDISLEARYAQSQKPIGCDFSQKTVYQSLSQSDQAAYRTLYLATFLHEDSVLLDGNDDDAIWRICNQMKYDSPELFNLGDTVEINMTEVRRLTTTRYETVQLTFTCGKEEASAQRQEAEDVVSECISTVEDCQSDRERAERLRTWVLDHLTYSEEDADSNAYAALVTGRASCLGYSQCYTWLMRASGVSCETVVGWAHLRQSTIGHAWNRALLEGEWRYLDITWDDREVPSREYAFVTEEEMAASGHESFADSVFPEEENDAE